MVGVGEPAPEFAGRTAEGGSISLADFRGRPLILYFFPKANTAGCTAEAKGFASHFPEFQSAGVAVVGVSVDSEEAQQQFAADCALPFPLVADRDRAIARAYGTLGLLGFAKRTTFFIGADGRVEEVVQGMLPAPHVRRAVERLRRGGPGQTL